MPTRAMFLIPALNAAPTLGRVLQELGELLWNLFGASEERPLIVVVDDGSTDETASIAEETGALVLRHSENLGKGAALRHGFEFAKQRGIQVVISLDADGQHPPTEAVRLLKNDSPVDTLVLGVRDLRKAGAPTPNQLSNLFSNAVLSLFGGRRLLDTQCGLRRYPVAKTLALGGKANGFAYESDLVLRAARKGLSIVFEPIDVVYPRGAARVTHFDSLRDPIKIVATVVGTTWRVPHHRRVRRIVRHTFLTLAMLAMTTLLAHTLVRATCTISAPEIELPAFRLEQRKDGTRVAGTSHAQRTKDLWRVRLHGTPEEIGAAHSLLLRDEMLRNEQAMLDNFSRYVPSGALRALLLDLAAFRYRSVSDTFSPRIRRELAAQAHFFTPDPFARLFPTFQRMIYLASLYDIALSYEGSPLIGCTTLIAGSDETSKGGPLLARAFDFGVDDILDERKAVFFVEEDGKIPYASVAWPGLVGVVSGMNLEGLALVVHGARAGDVRSQGEPVVLALRRVLTEARTTDEAITAFGREEPMVSHIVIALDSLGDARVIERVPGHPPLARPLRQRAAVTNHLEGPLANDPKNLRVRAGTTTLDRRQRADELLANASAPLSPETLVAMLRDRSAPGGAPLELGDPRALDANIATHAVVFDTAHRLLWVSRGPHLDGEFLAFDLSKLDTHDDLEDETLTLPARPFVSSKSSDLH